jgi:hypothetical protein
MWDPKKFIHGQNLRTTRNYTPTLITLIKTFYLILKSDHRNAYKLLNEIYDSVWHALVEFFFLKKRNTFIQNHFLSIITLAMESGNRSTITTILFKFNFLSKAYNIIIEIFPNSVMNTGNYDTFVANLKNLLLKICDNVTSRPELESVRINLFCTRSWVELNKILQKGKDLKKIGEQFALVQHGKGGEGQFETAYLLAIGRIYDQEKEKKVRAGGRRGTLEGATSGMDGVTPKVMRLGMEGSPASRTGSTGTNKLLQAPQRVGRAGRYLLS